MVRFAVDLPGDHQPALWDTQGPHLAIAPDGTTLAFSATDPRGAAVLSQPQLMRMPATGGQGRPAAPLDSAREEVAQYFPHALPDGRHVLYTSRGHGSTEDARIGLLDLSTGRARRLDVPGIYALGMLGGQLIFTDQAGTIMAVPLDLESGEVQGRRSIRDADVPRHLARRLHGR